MKNLIMIFGSVLFMLLAFTSCQEKTTSERVEDKMERAGDEMDKMADDVSDDFESNRDALKDELEEARKDANEELEEMKAKMADAKGKAKTEYKMQITNLENNLRELDQDIENVGKQMADGWDDFEAGVKSRMEKMEDALDDSL